MIIKQIELNKPYYNVDSTSLTSSLELVGNGYIDELGAFHKRGGYKLFCDLGTDRMVSGIHWSDINDTLIAVSNGKTFNVTDKYGSFVDLTGDLLPVDRRVSFVERRYSGTNYLFMVADSSPVFTDFTNNTQILSGSSTPPLTGSGTPPSNCTHLISFYSYLIGNQVGDMAWKFSYPGNPFRWDSADSYDISTQENVEGIYKGSSSFLVCSKSNLDIWGNSRSYTDPFLSPIKADFAQIGISSPYSVVTLDGSSVVLIDRYRRLVLISGTATKEIGGPINKELQKLSSVADSIAFNIIIDGRKFLLINFIQDEKTFVFDYVSQSFYKWSYWNEVSGLAEGYIANCYTYSTTWNKHLIGDRKTGKIYELDEDYNSDDGDNIVSEFITGHINYGSDALLKQPKRLIARIRRGDGKDGDVTAEPRFLIRYRDQNGSWSNFKEIFLGVLWDSDFRVVLYDHVKPYYSRQYHIKMPDPAPFVLSGIWEEF